MTHRRGLIRAFALACAATGLAGFAPQAKAIIINGTPAQAQTSSWDGIGTVTQGFDPGTGTLVDSLHVLTAAHLVNGFTASAVHFTVNGTQYNVSSIAIAPGYTDAGTQSDIAVLTLASPATGVATWGYNTGSFSESGKGVTTVGFGVSGTGAGGADGTTYPFGTKRAMDNTIDLATGATQSSQLTDNTPSHNVFNVPANMIAYDFDQTGNGNGPLGGASLGLTEGTIAIGDSGAPMFQFDSVSGKYIITGIAVDSSDLNDRFGEVGWGTRVSSYASFLATAVPEPTSLGLLVLAGIPLLRRRK